MENQNGFPGALPAIVSGLEGSQIDLVPGEGFWARIEQIAVKGEMTRGLDTAMHGRPSPRIWLFLHEPGRGELSAAVAMSFARELAFRDQAALVLDCDDQDQALTRWAGRLEAEGWIDLARYGTSVLTSGMPMPFVGRRGYLLGVGSFAPTDVTGKEVDTLLTRLRRQADDLILVAPADSAGLLWAPAAAIRILCWDRQTVSSETAAQQALKFEESGCPLTAVVTFQEAGAATEKLVEDVLAEVESPPAPVPPVVEEPAVPDPEPVDNAPADDGPIEDGAPDTEPEVDGDGDDVPEDPNWEDLPLEKGFAPDPGKDEEDFVSPPAEPEPARDTSRVFWVGALIALAVIVAASTYYFKYGRVPADGHFEQIQVTADTESAAYGDESQVRNEMEGGDATPPVTAIDSMAVAAEIVGDSLGGSEDIDSGHTEIDGAGVEAPDDKRDEYPVQEATGVDPAEDTVTESPVFDTGPYRGPVGEKGWALHVYSLADSPATAREVKELDRRGFRSEVRIFDLGEKGRWFRIYLGSFASRSEAMEAMPALLEKLRVDWAKPELFNASAPE